MPTGTTTASKSKSKKPVQRKPASKKPADGKKVGSAKQSCPLATMTLQVSPEDGGDVPKGFKMHLAGPSARWASMSGGEAVIGKLQPGKYTVDKLSSGWAVKDVSPATLVKDAYTIDMPASSKKTVKVKVTLPAVTSVKPEGGKTEKWYINLKTEKGKSQGRTVEITAELSDKIANVPVYFFLEPGAKNESKLHKDYEAKLLADHAPSDKNGIATVKLRLSMFGGDTFKVFATTDKKGKKGKKPSQELVVWRKLWFQRTQVEGCNSPKPGKAISAWEKVFVDFEESEVLNVKKADCPDPDRTFYPKSMLYPNNHSADEVGVIGAHNKRFFFDLLKKEAAKPMKAHIIVCDEQWDPFDKTSFVHKNITAKGDVTVSMSSDAKVKIIKPALSGNLVFAGRWVHRDKNNVKTTGPITDADISIKPGRASMSDVVVTLPAKAPVPTVSYPVTVSLRLNYAHSYLGESVKEHSLIVYSKSNEAGYNNTIAHEVGHSVGQTPYAPRGKRVPKGMPEHPHAYDDLYGGMGTHCNTTAGEAKGKLISHNAGYSKLYRKNITKIYWKGICVMFAYGVDTCSGEF